MGLKAFRVIVDQKRVEGLTFRKGTSKRSIMMWCLERKEFTKTEFLEAVKELKRKELVESRMDEDTCARAWWNELYNKYAYLIDAPSAE